ncbi:hypothetical protein BSNK01_30510 [Bacillaceae bacterium]
MYQAGTADRPPLDAKEAAAGQRIITGQWIIKWRAGFPQPRPEHGRVLAVDAEHRLLKVQLDDGVDSERWYEAWQRRPEIEYVQPNYTFQIQSVDLQSVKRDAARGKNDRHAASGKTVPPESSRAAKENVAQKSSRAAGQTSGQAAVKPVAQTVARRTAAPNDPYLGRQDHLRQIEAFEGWSIRKENTAVTIAVVDTGVDLDHPDLAPNLVKGINLLDPNRPPQDDNGHGTRAAGVLAARGNNGIGVAGVLWAAKIMPVKVLDENGEGDEFTVGQGIRQAVDKGVDVILMSLGDPIFSPHMRDAVAYAEKKGVVVVAAAGNDGSRVNYPAAFPTVIAVGAVDGKDKPLPYSNSGPEVDVVAPGEAIWTTELGGGYGTDAGTSLAAPQAAGLVGLILAKYPEMKPAQVRQWLKATAVDLEVPGWDAKTGYGRIDVHAALTQGSVREIGEPNDARDQAKVLPLESELEGALNVKDGVDWFRVDVPYTGSLRFRFRLARPLSSGIAVTFFSPGDAAGESFTVKGSREMTVAAPEGPMFVKVARPAAEPAESIAYVMENTFAISADPYEPNDTLRQAREIKGDGMPLTGTMHAPGDIDWFYLDVPQAGKLHIEVTTDTLRLDPVLRIEKEGEPVREIDEGSAENGQTESVVLNVKPGRYYLGLDHYYGHAVNGEYVLRVMYETPVCEPLNFPERGGNE